MQRDESSPILEVYEKVLWNQGDVRAFGPWVKKMGPNNLLIVLSSRLKPGDVPSILELEWAFLAS